MFTPQSGKTNLTRTPSFNYNSTISAVKPKWFIMRGAGIYTALIPADELPYSVNLQGVSPTMTADQVVGMTLVAETGPAKQRFLLDRSPSFPAHEVADSSSSSPSALLVKQFRAPDAHVSAGAIPHQNSSIASVDEAMSKAEGIQTNTEPLTPGRRTLSRPDSAIAVSADDCYPPQRPLPPSGQEPDETKKVYCSYWMRNGCCDFIQQGCKYKHVMPTDRRVLQRLGFRSTPKWYIEELARQAREGQSTPRDTSRQSVRTGGRAAPAPSPGQKPASTPYRSKAAHPPREEYSVRRGRMTNTTPPQPVPVAVEQAIKNTQPAQTTKMTTQRLSPPVVINPATSKPRTGFSKKPTLSKPSPAGFGSPSDSLSLIDLSDTEQDSPSLSGPAVVAATSKIASSLPSASSTFSSSNSENSEAPTEPLTPLTLSTPNTAAAAARVFAGDDKIGIFVPIGESPISHQERHRRRRQQQQQQRVRRKSSSYHSAPKTITTASAVSCSGGCKATR